MFVEILLLLFVLILLYKYFEKPEGIPPGKWGYPIVGQIVPKGVPIQDYFAQLKKEYGDIFSIKRGGRLYVVISDYNMIKTAFNKPELAGRPDFFTYGIFYYFLNIGIGGSQDKVWHDNRRFAMRHLRDLGMGKSMLEDTVTREVTALIEELDKTVDKPCELSWIINAAILNIIWGLVASKHHDINDPEILEFAELINQEFDAIDGPMKYLDMYPNIIPYVPSFIKNKWMKIGAFEKARDKFFDYAMKVVEEHVKQFNPEDPRDYIDWYLLEIENQKHDKDSTFRTDYMDLFGCISDLFQNGSETTGTSIRFTCLFLVLYPEVQKRIQKEIDEVVPDGTMPTMEHRDRLVYLEATLLEVQRKVSLTPMGVAHSALTDTTFAGYKIPKGTAILPFQEDCHTNSKYWEKPNDFHPEHFIDENGKLAPRRDGFLPFSVGKRLCPGESMAKMQLFLFMSAILQRYTITEAPGEKLTFNLDRNSLHFNGILPFNVVFKRRH